MDIDREIDRYLASKKSEMNFALLLGIWFIVEYILTIQATHNILFAMLRFPAMGISIIALFLIVLRIRNKHFNDTRFSKTKGWSKCTQLMFLAGLIEATGVFVINEWIIPGNLAAMHDAILAQYVELNNNEELMKAFPSLASMITQQMNIIEETPIETSINAAINMLSSDLFYGMLLGIPIGIILQRSEKEAIATSTKKKN